MKPSGVWKLGTAEQVALAKALDAVAIPLIEELGVEGAYRVAVKSLDNSRHEIGSRI